MNVEDILGELKTLTKILVTGIILSKDIKTVTELMTVTLLISVVFMCIKYYMRRH